MGNDSIHLLKKWYLFLNWINQGLVVVLVGVVLEVVLLVALVALVVLSCTCFTMYTGVKL